MIPSHLSATWSSLAVALGNHLWQSTGFAVAAGLLTLLLRKNHARVRYWLWLAASLKFLVPFSLLVTLGSHLAWSRSAPGSKAGFYFAMEEVSQPFTEPTIPMTPHSATSTGLIHLLPGVLTAAWLCGFVVVLFVWYARWRRISAAIREAVPLKEGRELETLRRLERQGGMRKQMEILLSRASLEPGIFGIARPVLVWPEGISARLEDGHLEAILAHELCHVRRLDNLAAAVHMVVEAIFWFYPLVWWLEARLLEERERACDEEVLESGSDRQVYAASILKICEFCVESPLACVSGVTGADLKRRIVDIMTEGVMRKLDFSRKLLLGAAGSSAIALPILFGLLHATQTHAQSQAQSAIPAVPAFESASIKPNNGEPMAGFEISGKPFKAIMWKGDRLMATNFTLHGLLQVAYGIQDDQISGGPDWLNSEGFDVDAKIGKSTIDEMQKRGRVYGASGRTLMFQALLSDRFKLSFHRETRDLPVFALVIAQNGPKIHPAKPGDAYPSGLKCFGDHPCGGGYLMEPESNKVVGQGIPLSNVVELLSEKLGGRTVLDKTGLTDKYDFTLQLAPEESEAAISKALEEQLGLRLEPQKAPMDVLVIDHAEEIASDEPAPSGSRPQNAAEPVHEAASIKPNKFRNPTVTNEPQSQSTPAIEPGYEVASVKPNNTGSDQSSLIFQDDGIAAANVTLQMLIRAAYGVQDFQISGAPNWLKSEKYDVQVKMKRSQTDELRTLSPEQRMLRRRRMLQVVLADRFKLSLHRDSKELPAYALVIAKAGPKLQKAEPDYMRVGRGELKSQGVRIATLARELSRQLGRPVLDETGLAGPYEFTLHWTPDESQTLIGFDGTIIPDNTPPADSSGLSVFAAVQEQLGLELEPQKAPMEVLAIDHAEKPSGN